MPPPNEAGLLLGAFSIALTQREGGAPPAGIVGPHGAAAVKRFAVYRNNVAASLVDALSANYPAIARLVGDAYFRALMGTFIAAVPPRSPVLHEYGAQLGDFIEGFAPLAAYPWLADVARLEWAWLEAYHAADAVALEPQELAHHARETLAGLCFTPHPATRLVRSPYPHVSIFRANRHGDGTLAGENAGEDALVTRPALDVELRLLPAGAAVFVKALVNGDTLAAASEAALADCRMFDITSVLAIVLEAGAFTRIHANNDREGARS